MRTDERDLLPAPGPLDLPEGGASGEEILIADDDASMRALLSRHLRRWGYEVLVAPDGVQALRALCRDPRPRLAILDWEMPELDGLQLCRRIRATPALRNSYVLLLTARGSKEDVVAGLEAGADDYLVKPFAPEELRARLRAGARILRLQHALHEERRRLAARVSELEAALEHVRMLQGILPICTYCRCVRDDQNYWQQLETYVSRHLDAQFSHGVCPGCYESVLQAELERARQARDPAR